MTKQSSSATLVAIAKDEGRYIAEWIAYHLAIGFDRIIVYDHESSDDTSNVVNLITNVDDRVKLIEWISEAGRSPQITAYENALDLIETTWLMFMDIDEFLVPFEWSGLPTYIRSIPNDASSVHINWRGFGSSGVESPRYELVTRTFKKCSHRGWSNNRHFKSLAKTDFIDGVNIHDIKTTKGRRVLSDFKEFETTNHGLSNRIVHQGIQINHYQCKTLLEFQKRMRLGNAYFPPEHPQRYHRDDSLERFAVLDRNDDEDMTIRLFDKVLDAEMQKIARALTTGPK